MPRLAGRVCRVFVGIPNKLKSHDCLMLAGRAPGCSIQVGMLPGVWFSFKLGSLSICKISFRCENMSHSLFKTGLGGRRKTRAYISACFSAFVVARVFLLFFFGRSRPFNAHNQLALAMKINAGKIAPIPSRYSPALFATIEWMLNKTVGKKNILFS